MLFFVCVLVLFFGSAPGPAPYIYGISDASAPRSAPTFFLMRRSHFLCVWSFLNAIMPLYMQAIFFSLSISLIFPLCSPHIFYVLSGHSLDRPAPVIPIVSWLVISFTFPLPPLILPIYFQNVTCARSAPVTFFEVVLAPYFSLYCSDVLLFFLILFRCSLRLLLFFLYFPLLFAPFWRLILSRPLR